MLSSCLSQHSGSSPSSLSEAEAGLVTSAVSKVRGYSPGTAVSGAWCRKACETVSLETCFPRLLHNILFTREWLKKLNSSQERKDFKKTMMEQGLHLGVSWGKGLSGWRDYTEWDTFRTSSWICGTWRMSPSGLLCALDYLSKTVLSCWSFLKNFFLQIYPSHFKRHFGESGFASW